MTFDQPIPEHDDLAGRALAILRLGLRAFWLGEEADACRHLEDAVELYRALGDQDSAACALDTLGRKLTQLGVLP